MSVEIACLSNKISSGEIRGQDKTIQDKKTRQEDKTRRQDKTRKDKTRQDKTRQDKTRQDDEIHKTLSCSSKF